MKEYLNGKKLVISATTSPRRREALKQIPDIELYSHPGPENELEDKDLSLVAKNKNEYLLDLLGQAEKSLKQNPEPEIDTPDEQGDLAYFAPAILAIIRKIIEYNSNYQIISSDTRTDIPQEKDGRRVFSSQGKPKKEDEVQQHFWQMHKTEMAIYKVFSGSHLQTYDQDYNMPEETSHQQNVIVTLRPEMVKFFSTDKGFAHYQKAFNEFYQSESYKKLNHQITSLQDISGGFSLPVFIKEKAVKAISFDGGKPIKIDKMNQEFLKKVIYLVAVGYSPKVLEKIMPEAYQFTLDNWSWLQEVVAEIAPRAKK